MQEEKTKKFIIEIIKADRARVKKERSSGKGFLGFFSNMKNKSKIKQIDELKITGELYMTDKVTKNEEVKKTTVKAVYNLSKNSQIEFYSEKKRSIDKKELETFFNFLKNGNRGDKISIKAKPSFIAYFLTFCNKKRGLINLMQEDNS